MSVRDIIKTEPTARTLPVNYHDRTEWRVVSGLDLHMKDGTVWFHPNSGADPFEVTVPASYRRVA